MYITTHSTWGQLGISLRLFIVGMLIGVIYIVCLAIKGHFHKRFSKVFMDILFCVIMFAVVECTLYVVTGGDVALYMVVSMLSGFVSGRMIFEKTVKSAINKGYYLADKIKKQLNIKAK